MRQTIGPCAEPLGWMVHATLDLGFGPPSLQWQHWLGSMQQCISTSSSAGFSVLDQINDGLHQLWSGKVFVSPPFGMAAGKSQQGLFLEKSTSEYWKAHVSEVLLLLCAAIGYNWLSQALKFPHGCLEMLLFMHPTSAC